MLGMVEALELRDCVEVRGPELGPQKEASFRWADVFVHTSRFEGHPLSVLEALARGLPCLLTTGTNIGELVQSENAGWCIEPSATAVASGLLRVRLSARDFASMGERARNLAEKEFSWSAIAHQMVAEYIALLQAERTHRP